MRAITCLTLAANVAAFAPPQRRAAVAPRKPVARVEPCARSMRNLVVTRADPADLVDVAFNGWEWTANMGAPAALVAAAALTSYEELRQDKALVTIYDDRPWVRVAKKVVKFLLISSFALQVLSIFTTTITGTMLLSVGDKWGRWTPQVTEANSPMGFLQANFEFEYLTSRISFIQGLFNWMGAMALSYAIPHRREGMATRRMNKFFAWGLSSMLLAMMSFYNEHLRFYTNYLGMLKHWFTLVWARFIWRWPPKLLSIAALGAVGNAVYHGYRAFTSEPDVPEHEAQG
mmetsp:Transcript_10469/g.31252  ORF Transcript_10469/g.31252 Transcript_10469/m.31252 type:complete len:288 (+) Transcript_10469:135-998(+)